MQPGPRKSQSADRTRGGKAFAGKAMRSRVYRSTRGQAAGFDNSTCYAHPAYERLYCAIRDADGVLLAVPIYNWAVASTAKSLIELTGATGAGERKSAWFDQIVTFVCSGGLPHSYMAYGNLAMSLMLDFKCVINPYVVYVTDRDWNDNAILSDTLAARLRKTIDVKLELSSKLSSRTYTSDWEI
jgi:NAD(P)H-dependent FMN reductase